MNAEKPDKRKKILITGATGFIGKALFNRLTEEAEYIITVVSRSDTQAAYFMERGAEFIKADISRIEDMNGLSDSFDMIIHSAGCVSNGPENKANPLSTDNICRLAVESAVERLIYISSVSVVSANKEIPLREELPYAGSTLYAESKIEAEKVAISYREKGLRLIILRPPIVYGEEEPHFIPLLRKLIRLRLFPLPSEGRARFHMVYVENLVDAMLFSMRSEEMFEGSYFTADSEALTVKEVFSLMAEGFGVKRPVSLNVFCTGAICRIPMAGRKFRFFTKDRVYSTEKLEGLGFKPGVSPREALLKSTRNYKA